MGYNRDEICRQIRKKRKECRFTQKELATEIGLAKNTITVMLEKMEKNNYKQGDLFNNFEGVVKK